MSDDTIEDDDDEVARRLVALDEALVSGKPPFIHQFSTDTTNAQSTYLLQLLRKFGASSRVTPKSRSDDERTLVDHKDDSVLASNALQTQSFGRFTIDRELGRGGYGIVFLAHDPILSRDVALKVPHAGVLTDDTLRQRFHREAIAAAGLDHPHIVRVYEAGDVGPVCYIAAEFCPGLNLENYLAQRDSLPTYVDTASIIADLADAVNHAHGRGVFHRDLKPANIMLQPRHQIDVEHGTAVDYDAMPLSAFTARITDFGLAKTTDNNSQMTQSGAIVGTPSYMAPEQASGKCHEHDAKLDVYSLGAMLYQLLTGYVPFQGDSPLETLKQVISQEPVPPRKLRRSVPLDLETICLKCLEKNPINRFQNASQLRDELRRFLRSEPIRTRHIGELERFWRLCRRRPLISSLSLALLVSIVAGLITTSFLWRQSEKRRTQTLSAFEDADRSKRDAITQRDQSDRMLYLHSIALAQRESSIDLDRANNLLQNCDPALRNWEWHFLKRMTDRPLLTLVGHQLPVQRCIFAADRRTMVSASGNWGSPDPGEVIVWDLMNGKVVHRLQGLRHSVMNIAMHPKHSWIAVPEFSWTENVAGTLHIFDAITGTEVKNILTAEGVFSVAFSPNGEQLAAVDFAGRVHLIDTATWDITKTMQGHTDNTFSVDYSPNGEFIASCSRDGTVCIWRSTDGALLLRFRPLADTRNVLFSPDGTMLAVTSFAGEIKLWDMVQNKEIANYNSRDSRVEAIQFSPDGRFLAFATKSLGFVVLYLATGRVIRELPSHYSTNMDLAFDPDGMMIATAGGDGRIRVWDFSYTPNPSGAELKELQSSYVADAIAIPNTSSIAVANMKHGSRADLGRGDFVARIFDLATNAKPRVLQGHKSWLNCIASDRTGDRLVTGSDDGTVRIWEIATGKELENYSTPAVAAITNAVFCEHDNRIAAIEAEGSVVSWQIGSQEAPWIIKLPHGQATALSYLDTENVVVIGDDVGTLYISEAANGQLLYNVAAHKGKVLRLAVDRKGECIASVGTDRQIRIWRVTRSELNSPPKLSVVHENDINVPEDNVYSLDFSPDASRLISASADGVVRLWDCKSGQEVMRLEVSEQRPPTAFFSWDGRKIHVASGTRLSTFEGAEFLAVEENRLQKLFDSQPAWHRRESLSSSRGLDGFATLFHMDRSNESESTELLKRRAEAMAEMERWDEAEELMKQATIDGNKDDFLQYERALIRFHRGDEQGFRAIVEESKLRFGSSNNAGVINNLAWMACMVPSDDSALEQFLESVRAAQKREKDKSRKANLYDTQAMLLYRLKRFDEALESNRQSILLHGKGGTPHSLLLMALIVHGQGRNERAIELLSKTDKEISMTKGDRIKHNPIAGPWHQRIEIERMLQMAKDIIKPEAIE